MFKTKKIVVPGDQTGASGGSLSNATQPQKDMTLTRKKRKRKTRTLLIVLGSLVVVILIIVLAAGGKEKPIDVQTEKVGFHTITEVVQATGKIQPQVMVKVSPEVSGEIIELPFKEGDRVKKGDLVAKIKP